jgi:hypothetical protein
MRKLTERETKAVLRNEMLICQLEGTLTNQEIADYLFYLREEITNSWTTETYERYWNHEKKPLK